MTQGNGAFEPTQHTRNTHATARRYCCGSHPLHLHNNYLPTTSCPTNPLALIPISIASTVPLALPYIDRFNSASRTVFGKDPHEWQSSCGSSILSVFKNEANTCFASHRRRQISCPRRLFLYLRRRVVDDNALALSRYGSNRKDQFEGELCHAACSGISS